MQRAREHGSAQQLLRRFDAEGVGHGIRDLEPRHDLRVHDVTVAGQHVSDATRIDRLPRGLQARHELDVTGCGKGGEPLPEHRRQVHKTHLVHLLHVDADHLVDRTRPCEKEPGLTRRERGGITHQTAIAQDERDLVLAHDGDAAEEIDEREQNDESRQELQPPTEDLHQRARDLSRGPVVAEAFETEGLSHRWLSAP